MSLTLLVSLYVCLSLCVCVRVSLVPTIQTFFDIWRVTNADYLLTYLLGVSVYVCMLLCMSRRGFRLHPHRHEYESEFSVCLHLVQASPARVEHSRSLVQAHDSTRVY